MLEQARGILKQAQDAAIGVRRRGRGETGRINVGSSGAIFHPIVVRALHESKTRYPNLAIAAEVEVTNTSLLLAWLRTGRVDLCLISVPVDDNEGLAIEPLVDEDCVIALPTRHALANCRSTPLKSLAEDNFVLFSRAFSPALHDSVITACERVGFKPKVDQEVPQIVNVIPAIAAGFGVSIIPRSFGEIHYAGVKYIEIDGRAPRSALALVYRRDERSAAIKNIIKAARIAKRA